MYLEMYRPNTSSWLLGNSCQDLAGGIYQMYTQALLYAYRLPISQLWTNVNNIHSDIFWSRCNHIPGIMVMLYPCNHIPMKMYVYCRSLSFWYPLARQLLTVVVLDKVIDGSCFSCSRICRTNKHSVSWLGTAVVVVGQRTSVRESVHHPSEWLNVYRFSNHAS